MSANEEKIKADKFALIYEFNNSSPLFTRVASKYLENGEPEKALPMLEEGIRNYRTYPTAIILYSLALAMVGKKDDAIESLERIRSLFNSDSTIEFYKAKIDSIKETDNLTNYDFSSSIFDKSIPEDKNSSLINTEIDASVAKPANSEDEDLQELAEKLNNASIPLTNENDNFKQAESTDTNDTGGFPGKSLVSETLAKIYFNQGNFNEALSIYETLLEIQPEKADYFKSQIDKINEQKSIKEQ